MSNIPQEILDLLPPETQAELAEACTVGRAEMITRLLAKKNLTPASFARKHAFPASSVYACIRKERPHLHIRAALVRELGQPEELLFGDWGEKAAA